MIDFSSSIVIVTGSSRGLGEALSKLFLDKGAKVVGISRSSSITHSNYEHKSIDLSDLTSLKRLEIEFNDDYKNLILINNAGRLGEVKPFDQLEEEDIIATAHLNYLAPLLLVRRFLRMECNSNAQKYVLNIGTGAANNPIDGWSMYCSSKAGLQMFSKVLHLETGIHEKNIKIVDIAPGIIDTKMQSEIRSTSSEEFSNHDRFVSLYENGELMGARETAELIIRNFENLFSGNQGTDSIRNYF